MRVVQAQLVVGVERLEAPIVEDEKIDATERALGVDGYDDPRIATIVERMAHRELTGQIMDRCYAAAATM